MGISDREHLRTEAGFLGVDSHAIFLQPGGPVRQAAERHLESDLDRHTVTKSRRRQMPPREKRQVRAGMTLGVGVEKVIGPRIVLVDALLDEPHTENARVEIEVLLRGAGDSGDVMKSVYASHGHRGQSSIFQCYRFVIQFVILENRELTPLPRER